MIVERSPFLVPKAVQELRLPYSGYVTTDESWRQPPLRGDISRLYLVEEGSGVVYSDTEQMLLEPGNVYLLPKGAPCGYYGTDRVKKLFFHVELEQNYRDVFENSRHFLSFPIPIARIRELTALYFSDRAEEQLRLQSAVLELLMRFMQHPRYGGDLPPQLSAPVRCALELIAAAPRADIRVSDLAEHCHVSAALLGRRFREELGVTPSAYVERCVMEEARRLLTGSDRSLGEISEQLGFCDQFYFSRRFRAFFGVSPRSYRKNSIYT